MLGLGTPREVHPVPAARAAAAAPSARTGCDRGPETGGCWPRAPQQACPSGGSQLKDPLLKRLWCPPGWAGAPPHRALPQLPATLHPSGSLSLSPPFGPTPSTVPGRQRALNKYLCSDVKSAGRASFLTLPKAFCPLPESCQVPGSTWEHALSWGPVLLRDSHFLSAGLGLGHPVLRQSPWHMNELGERAHVPTFAVACASPSEGHLELLPRKQCTEGEPRR